MTPVPHYAWVWWERGAGRAGRLHQAPPPLVSTSTSAVV